MQEVKIIEWLGYEDGAITCDSVADKRKTSTGNIKVTDHNGDVYDVHPLVYECGNCRSDVGVYPIRWKEVTH